VSARIDLTEPKDIPVNVTLEPSKVSIAPFLSNPGDKVYLSIITSGVDPVISVKARIAGIREIKIEDSSVVTVSPLRIGIDLIVSLGCLTTYFIHALIPRCQASCRLS
jgi:siroheme synthase (precorrin-2 oxidase/ferrochelatase)